MASSQGFAAGIEQGLSIHIVTLQVGGFCHNGVVEQAEINSANERHLRLTVEQPELLDRSKGFVRPIDTCNDLHDGPYYVSEGQAC